MVKTVLQIDGMMCPMCESHVNDAIRNAFPGVSKVRSSHRKGRTEIRSETPLDETALRAAVERCGYRLLSCAADA